MDRLLGHTLRLSPLVASRWVEEGASGGADGGNKSNKQILLPRRRLLLLSSFTRLLLYLVFHPFQRRAVLNRRAHLPYRGTPTPKRTSLHRGCQDARFTWQPEPKHHWGFPFLTD